MSHFLLNGIINKNFNPVAPLGVVAAKQQAANYIHHHYQSLSGAISLILGTLLHQDGTFEHYGAQKAFQVLYQFNSLLQPPHNIDI